MPRIDHAKAMNMWHWHTLYSCLWALAIVSIYMLICVLTWMWLGPLVTVILGTLFLVAPFVFAQTVFEHTRDHEMLLKEPEEEDLRRIQLIYARFERRTKILLPPILMSAMPTRNAFLVDAPSRGDAFIAITQLMLKSQSERTLAVITAHELGHYLAWDYFLCHLATYPLYLAEFLVSLTDPLTRKSLTMELILRLPLFPIFVLVARMSREREFAADAFMAWVVGEVDSFEMLLEDLSQQESFERPAHELLWRPGMTLGSHPMNIERMQALRKLQQRPA